MKVSVIIVAAGSGRRFGYERNKLFFPLCGKPVLTHTLQHVFAASCVSEVVIVVAERDRKDICMTGCLGQLRKVMQNSKKTVQAKKRSKYNLTKYDGGSI